MINEMLLHTHFQTVIHAAADKIPPITLPLVVSLISAILYKSRGGKGCRLPGQLLI